MPPGQSTTSVASGGDVMVEIDVTLGSFRASELSNVPWAACCSDGQEDGGRR